MINDESSLFAPSRTAALSTRPHGTIVRPIPTLAPPCTHTNVAHAHTHTLVGPTCFVIITNMLLTPGHQHVFANRIPGAISSTPTRPIDHRRPTHHSFAFHPINCTHARTHAQASLPYYQRHLEIMAEVPCACVCARACVDVVGMAALVSSPRRHTGISVLPHTGAQNPGARLCACTVHACMHACVHGCANVCKFDRWHLGTDNGRGAEGKTGEQAR